MQGLKHPLLQTAPPRCGSGAIEEPEHAETLFAPALKNHKIHAYLVVQEIMFLILRGSGFTANLSFLTK